MFLTVKRIIRRVEPAAGMSQKIIEEEITQDWAMLNEQ